MRINHTVLILFYSLLIVVPLSGITRGTKIEKWKRFEARFEHRSWRGNPFAIILKGIFVSPSGRTMKQFGFYEGNDSWKLFFMPDEEGQWTYKTESPEAALNGKEGRFTCTPSNLEGLLTTANNRWAITSNGGDFPVIWNPPVSDGMHWGFRGRDYSDSSVRKALKYAEEIVGARLLGFGELFITPIDWAKDWPQSAVPYVVGHEGDEFYIPFWDQLNLKLDAARDRNMGTYIMLYGDDAMTPDHFGLKPRSDKELCLFRYVVARLACYPQVLWDSGIDIGEYRDAQWIDWYVAWFQNNDPWHHPAGSRSGGGSGGIMPASGSYYSTGGASLPGCDLLLNIYQESKVPVAHTDHWRPFIKRGSWTNRKIRIAMWRCGLTGAQALYPDYNQGKIDTTRVREGGQYIGSAMNFFRREIRSNLLELEPHNEFIVNGDNAILAANPGKEYIVYDENGGSFTIEISETSGMFYVNWYNPRNGETIPHHTIQGHRSLTFRCPSNGEDWVLHIFKDE